MSIFQESRTMLRKGGDEIYSEELLPFYSDGVPHLPLSFLLHDLNDMWLQVPDIL